MKCLKRNKRLFHYSLYLGKEKVRDEEGHYTGEQTPLYSQPTALYANISAATGSTQVDQFGSNLQYDKVIVVDDPNCPIDENSVLFVDKLPEENKPIFDYIVKKAARSLNSVSYAIAKEEVSR